MKTQVVVIGGGATGSGVLRDPALRGIEAILLEKNELTSGTSGRNHGLLHSGARYAVKDPDSARECIAENYILKKIALPCIEDTGGFFLSLPPDPPDYPEELLRACENLGIPIKEIPVEEALEKEPALSPDILRAFHVPDGALDPFRLIRSNVEEGQLQGAKVFPYREVISILTERGKIHGLRALDLRRGEEFQIQCHFLVNAAGSGLERSPVWLGLLLRSCSRKEV